MAKHTLRYIYIKKIMSKKLTLTEDQLTGIVKKILEQELSDDEVLARLEDGGVIDDETEDEI